ncbi:hypothetical protein [Schlesneria sp. DSM 10557]|uniref:hypothetical protein n=1 Tax=Schlesneria sp. DSM 10557 TaxID=3044399 RepID=UPI00359FAE11
MPQISQTTIADVIGRLPQLVLWSAANIESSIRLLIVCAGFEERAAAIVKELKHVTVDHLLVIEYPTNQAENATSLSRFDSIRAKNRHHIKYSRSTFLSDVGREVERCVGSPSRILIDVSAMASYVTSRVLKSVWERCGSSSVLIFYAEAQTYHPTHDDWNTFFANVPDPDDNLSIAACYEDSYFQSRGVDETYECDAFPGRNEGPLATELVIIPSFSLQRVKSMTTLAEARYNVTAKTTHWFLGSPPNKSTNGWRFDAVAKLYNVRSGGVAVDTRDYRDILRKLDETWTEALKNERHLVLGGMGSKLQNIGVFLFLTIHSECGLLHCEPKEFIANRYTEGIGPTWCLDIGEILAMKDLLESRGSLKFMW